MAEQARYAVRTPLMMWLVSGGLIAAVVVMMAGALMFRVEPPPALVYLALVLCSGSVAFWFGMNAYRVGGGRNLIRFYADRIEVPAVHDRKPLVFPREGLQLDVRDVVVQYRMVVRLGAQRRGKLIELRNGHRSRKLSTLVLDDRNDERALIADLQRFIAGQPAIGRVGHDAPAARTEYDDRLDRELAELE